MIRTVAVSALLSTVGLLAVVTQRGELADLRAVASVGAPALVAATALLMVSHLAGATRLFMTSRLLGAPIGFGLALRAYLFGLFSAAVTPGGGGHAVAIGMALRHAGLPASTAWSVAVYPTLVDLLFYAWALPVALLILAARPDVGLPLPGWLALPASLGILAGWYLLAFRLPSAERWLARVFSLGPLRRWRRGAWRFTHRFAAGITSMSRAPWHAHLLLQGTTVALHVAVHLIVFTVAHSLGAPLAWLPTLAVVLLVSAIGNVVPTPGGSGFLEAALLLVLTRQAAAHEVAPAVLVWRGLAYYANLALGPVAGAGLASPGANRVSDTV